MLHVIWRSDTNNEALLTSEEAPCGPDLPALRQPSHAQHTAARWRYEA